MAKAKTEAEKLFAEVRTGMLEAVPVCTKCNQPTVKIAPIARQIGITPPTLEAYVRRNKSVSQKVFGKFVNYLAQRRAAAEAETTAETA